MIRKFIDRPVLSAVISLFIVLLGALAYYTLPVTQYPDIAPPTIQINATYSGANAETVMKSVIVPIEEEVNGVEGMTYITSNADNNGTASITVFFQAGTDADIAAVNVQNRVARATPLLPVEVIRTGVVTEKKINSALMFIAFYSKNKLYDEVFVQNYLDINLIPALKRIKGVSDATIMGGKQYAMRVWLNPKRLEQFHLIPSDIFNAIQEQSLEASPGQIGQNAGEAFQYTIKYSGKLNKVQQYKNIIIKTGANGELVRLKDVADVKLDALSNASVTKMNGYPAVKIVFYQTSGSNAQKIILEAKEIIKNSKADFPEGINYYINYDTNDFLTASMSKIQKTLLEAFILVFIVVFIFLQDFRTSLIPAIAVPVSIIGTFLFLSLFGLTINLLTLFALILAIGIVVDDAIVVVEAVHAKMEASSSTDMKEITDQAMSGITTAIISITLVMSAVFIPVTFISGAVGAFYKEFGITLMIAIVISAINALTLSPMLCALILKPKNNNNETKGLLQRFYLAFNTSFKYMVSQYARIVRFLIRYKWIAFALIIISTGGLWWINKTTPKGFIPNEDQKVIFIDAELPAGSSLDRTVEVMDKLMDQIKSVKGIAGTSYDAGRSLINGTGSNFGFGILSLKDWANRDLKGAEAIDSIKHKLFAKAGKIPDAKFIFFTPPTVRGFGHSAGFSAEVIDKTGGSYKELDKVTQEFRMKLNQRPEIMYSKSNFKTNYPQYEMIINVPLASQKGIGVKDILSAMSGYVGGVYTNDFIKYGKKYRVMVQSNPDSRNNIKNLNTIYVRTPQMEMIPINQFISFEKVYGPQSVNRFNLFTSASLSGASNPEYSTGDAITALQEVAGETLPQGYGLDFSGLSREQVKSSSQTLFIFLLSLIFVYLLLAAQYESFLLPISILISLPLGISGAYLAQKLAGLPNNIYFQIALIVLIGLLAKNAILIVEYALEKRRQGYALGKAAIMGAKERLRPILMTSFAFILGLMPLVMATGVGANGNRTLATGASFGLLIGTVFGLLVIPTMFVVFQSLQEKIKR